MFEAISDVLYKWKLKKNTDCFYSDLFLNRFGDEFHHVDYLMVNGNRIILVKYYDYIGNIYGAENISEWTQTIGHSGFKFGNPLRELRELVTQIKEKMSGFEVDFYILFSDRCNFPKPMPEKVVKRTELLNLLKEMEGNQDKRDCDSLKSQIDAVFRN